MKNFAAVFASLCLFSGFLQGVEPSPDATHYWPQWRGPHATGVSPHGKPPVEWSENRNIRWKVEIPGEGSATPIIWNDRIFVLTAIPTKETVQPPTKKASQDFGIPRDQATRVQQFSILALSRRDGKTLWTRVLRRELPHEGRHATSSWASGSPVTDGQHVFAFFGSRGLYSLDMEGHLLWEKDFGDMTIRFGFGEGASPTLHRDRILINWDHQGQSFIAALDKGTGREIWRTDRDEITSWATPVVVPHAAGNQVVTNATNSVRSYDLETGELIWESQGMTLNTIPSPVASRGMVFVTSGFRGNALQAIRLADARGDITGSKAIIWDHDQDTPYVPSPLLYDDTLYFLKHNSGVLSSLNARTGEQHYTQMRLKELADVYASPVGAANRVYIVGREGVTVVLEHGPEFKVLAVNVLEEGFDASPAVVDREIYLRGKRHLYCIAEE